MARKKKRKELTPERIDELIEQGKDQSKWGKRRAKGTRTATRDKVRSS